VCMSLCVSEWMRNIYVSFLCLQVCLPVCERFLFDTAAVVTDGDPAWSSVHFECCEQSDWESTVCSSQSLTTVLTRPSFTTSQAPLEKQIQQKLYLWLSPPWSIQAHSVPFPLCFTMTTSPVAQSFVFSW